MTESDLYPIVVNYLLDKMKCLDARKTVGPQLVGSADAFGIKDIGGRYNSAMIGYAIEVKEKPRPFGKRIGQALGYSLFSHRCYLAVPTKFTEEQIEMANRLGVGLLEIKTKEETCMERLTAQHHQPIEGLFSHAVYRLGYVQCKMCGEFVKITSRTRKSSVKSLKDNQLYYNKLKKKVYYHNEPGRWGVTLCPKCFTEFRHDGAKNK